MYGVPLQQPGWWIALKADYCNRKYSSSAAEMLRCESRVRTSRRQVLGGIRTGWWSGRDDSPHLRSGRRTPAAHLMACCWSRFHSALSVTHLLCHTPALDGWFGTDWVLSFKPDYQPGRIDNCGSTQYLYSVHHETQMVMMSLMKSIGPDAVGTSSSSSWYFKCCEEQGRLCQKPLLCFYWTVKSIVEENKTKNILFVSFIKAVRRCNVRYQNSCYREEIHSRNYRDMMYNSNPPSCLCNGEGEEASYWHIGSVCVL